MSVLLQTTNPAAARRATPGPMPAQGDTVVYYMRPGEMRAGQKTVPAIVLAVDPDNRQLKLLVMYDHQDMMTLERIPERTGFDQGWALRSDGGSEVLALRAEVLALRSEIVGMAEGLEAFKLELAQTLFGEHDKPAESFEDRIRRLAADLKPLRAAAKKAK